MVTNILKNSFANSRLLRNICLLLGVLHMYVYVFNGNFTIKECTLLLPREPLSTPSNNACFPAFLPLADR